MPTLKDIDAEVLDYLNSAPQEIIRCRLLRHAWEPTHDGYLVADPRDRHSGLLQHLHCLRCGTEAFDEFDRITLERVGRRRYVYVEGYTVKGLPIDRHDARVFEVVKAQAQARRRKSAA